MKLTVAVHSVGPEGLLNFTGFAWTELYFVGIPVTTFSLPKGLSKEILLFSVELFKFNGRIS